MNRRRNLGFFFDQSVARRPDKVAIIDLFGGRERRATYRQLDERMNDVASMLARLGVVPGERVAMLIGKPHGVHRILLRIDARRRDPAAAQHAARCRHAR